MSIFACSGYKKQADVTGISLSPFIGCWESTIDNDSIKSLSLCIGERNDSLLVAMSGIFFGGSKIQSAEYDKKERLIPHARIVSPKSGNTASGNICKFTHELFF